MELVDIYNEQYQYVRTQQRFDNKALNEYNKSVHAYIINNNNELLIQKRSDTKKENPGMWEAVGGGVEYNEDSQTAILREIKEEINKTFYKNDLEFIGTIKYPGYIADVYVVKCNDAIETFKIQEGEVSDIKWATHEDIEELLKQNIFYSSSYNYFNNYYLKNK